MHTQKVNKVIVFGGGVLPKVTELLRYILKREPLNIECVCFLEYRLSVMTTLAFGHTHCLPFSILELMILDEVIYDMYIHTNWALVRVGQGCELCIDIERRNLIFTPMENLTYDQEAPYFTLSA